MIALSFLTIILLIISLGIILRVAFKIAEENRLLSESIGTAKLYHEVMRDRIMKLRKFRHDAAGLLYAIDEYDPDLRRTMAGEMAGVTQGTGKTILAMPLLEAVVELKRRQCAENSIAFECPDRFPQELIGDNFPAESDLCLLIQNLLENAYEASLRIPDTGQRKIRLTVSEEKHRDGQRLLIFEVSNNINPKEKVTFLTRKKRPEMHGIGLRIIEDIVKKYDGRKTVITDQENHQVIIRVQLQM